MAATLQAAAPREPLTLSPAEYREHRVEMSPSTDLSATITGPQQDLNLDIPAQFGPVEEYVSCRAAAR